MMTCIRAIMILPSSHSSHNGGGCMRTMRRLKSYEDSANYGLKYSQLSGVSGTNTIKITGKSAGNRC
ncbi:MAG: hypothetical protein HDT48_05895 [Ruminococcaceae bacterium]|nr:hypothetical protein [Oscillospiraceae bacterium]